MILVQSLHNLFHQIIDEVQSDYFTSSQVDQWLNDAQRWLFRRLYNPDTGPRANEYQVNGYLESSRKISEYLTPFMLNISGPFTSGVLDRGFLSTYLGQKKIVFVLTGVEVKYDSQENYKPIKWKSNSERVFQTTLSFYKPESCEPIMYLQGSDYKFDPAEDGEFRATALVYPDDVSLSGAVNSEFPTILDRVIAYKAAELASISTRDTEFVQNIQMQINRLGL